MVQAQSVPEAGTYPDYSGLPGSPGPRAAGLASLMVSSPGSCFPLAFSSSWPAMGSAWNLVAESTGLALCRPVRALGAVLVGWCLSQGFEAKLLSYGKRVEFCSKLTGIFRSLLFLNRT